jgi:hypothetical protein
LWRRRSAIGLILVVLLRRGLLALGRRLLLLVLLLLLLVRLLLLVVLLVLLVVLLLLLRVRVLSSTLVGRLLLVGSWLSLRLRISRRLLSCLALPLLLWRCVSCLLPASRVAILTFEAGRAEGWQSQTTLPD